MERRAFLARGSAVAAAAVLPKLFWADYTLDGLHAEVAQYVDRHYPDDIERWPEVNRLVARAALLRFMDQNPGAKVVKEAAACVDKSYSRFQPAILPDGSRLDYALLFVVKFDRRVA